MDNVANLTGIKPIELVYVQRVRLYLGVTTLADISTSDGKKLCAWALSVNENPRIPIFRFPQPTRTTNGILRPRNLAPDYPIVFRAR
jgi:hypothetical protein